MSKVSYIIKASNDTMSENAAKVLMVVAKTNFVSSADIRESLKNDVTPNAVNSNIGVLIKKNLIEKSGDGLVVTAEGQELINASATLFASEQNPELLKSKATRKPRGTTVEMEETIKFIESLIDGVHDVKEIEINRSNMGVVLSKRLCSGVRKLEVMRKDVFRIFGYKVNQEKLDEFEKIGMTYRISKNGSAYIDKANADYDFIKKAIELI